MKTWKLLLVLFLSFCCTEGRRRDQPVEGEEVGGSKLPIKKRDRDGKFISVFSIYSFQNGACIGSGSMNGTCYTKTECSDKGGTASGTCAEGFGVCCIFSYTTCGSTSNQNLTYFVGSSPSSGACTLKICPCSSDICQLRLDFNTFTIAGPTTATASVMKSLSYVPNSGGISQSLGTRCITDLFTVSNPGGQSPPAICGSNGDTHMYVDASEQCNDLQFKIGSSTTTSRSWNIKVTQYSCTFNNLPPKGCTQYHFGSTTGLIKTYNFAGSVHLADQEQHICIRRERSTCRMCLSESPSDDFHVSGTKSTEGSVGVGCCELLSSKAPMGVDCLLIPGAHKTAKTTSYTSSRWCGNKLAIGTTAKSVCTSVIPFRVSFFSDAYEMTSSDTSTKAAESKVADKGFQLTYVLDCP